MSQTGAQSTKTLSLLSQTEVNHRLKEHEASYAVTRKNNPVIRYDTNALPSNSPLEDDSCTVVLERDPGGKVKGDLMFWGVFDGHSGWQTSRLLSSNLVSYVARELDLVFRSSQPYLSLLDPSLAPSTSSSYWSLLGSGPSNPKNTELDLHDSIMQQAIKNAFEGMDQEIVNAPMRLLEKLQKEGKAPKLGRETGISAEQTEALNTLLPALSGSCSLLAVLDAGRNKLHVACTGDSRAVMGTWEPSASGGGKWRAEPLSEDQTGKNPKEVERIKSAHPSSESETVIVRGRVLGGLEPTRAFGDARYKWALGVQEKLAEAFHVIATPEVVSIDLAKGLSAPRKHKSLSSFLPVSSSAEPPPPEATRFIVLATDGLYDRLNNEEVVSLVGAHLSGVRGIQTRANVLSHVVETRALETTHATHVPRQEPARGEGEVFTFEDGNLSTHLVRNALGGAKREQVAALLSIPAPLSRRYRDDITVTVILLNGNGAGEGGSEGGAGGVHKREDVELDGGRVRAKL
ncbi:protein phosphatase 2C family protein [Pseudohyphozyma bogoriensis]|nr:protein phosphatase 2C family protein [Pseudohyphozyma bogoriensis]